LRSRLADYQILGPAGPAGDTWLAAAPPRLGLGPAPVVITALGSGAGQWSSLSETLASLASVHSPFLPRLIEAGQTDEEDGTIAWVAREDGRPRSVTGPDPDPGAALRRLAGAARGAHALHEAGWVHGDIRPRSLLERGEDTMLEPPVRGLPGSGSAPPPDLAPVDLDGREPATIWGEGPSRAADIWALGATAHHVLSGGYLHPALQQDVIVTAVQRVLVEPPAVAASLPPAVSQLLRSCLDPDPDERPPTAADLADRLQQLTPGR
jgi:serine/threonine protein kinase